MSTVVFERTYPPSNLGGLPWTQIRVEESDQRDGVWLQIDSQSIPPLTVDPASEAPMTVTTGQARMDSGWYRIVWANAAAQTALGDLLYNAPSSATPSTIARLVKSLMPTTWDHLSRSTIYGEDLLNERIEAAKYDNLPVEIASSDESSYSMLLKGYVSKLAALEIIPSAIDYWMNQKLSIVNTGTAETIVYPDRSGPLLRLSAWLQQEVARLRPLVADETKVPGRPSSAPAVSQAGPLVTADPYGFDTAFDNSLYETNGPVVG